MFFNGLINPFSISKKNVFLCLGQLRIDGVGAATEFVKTTGFIDIEGHASQPLRELTGSNPTLQIHLEETVLAVSKAK